jgi:aminoglycoside/choline kinase family phosphotransferase
MHSATDRSEALRRFVAATLGDKTFTLAPASADASFRSYWRVRAGAQSWIVMDAPPEKESLAAWLDIDRRLRKAAVNAPEVLAEDRDQGLLLLADLGTRTYLPELNEACVDALYADAFDALLRMKTVVDAIGLPYYERARLVAEMELLPEWFLKRHLGVAPTCEEWDIIEAAFTRLTNAALEQPQRFVHRDYHSRNLMIVPRHNPGVIDFQDAVIGPITYDLVSLLRDCYIEWPSGRVDAWVEQYRQRLVSAAVSDADPAQFRRWFDLMGLQRHLKVLGIFCRLWYRDGKAGYLADLPLTLRYALNVARTYPEFTGLAALLERAVAGRDITHPRQDIAAATP